MNELVQAFRNDYPDKDSQDFLAMTAFQVAYSNLVMQEKADESPLLGELKDIRDDVDDFYRKSQPPVRRVRIFCHTRSFTVIPEGDGGNACGFFIN